MKQRAMAGRRVGWKACAWLTIVGGLLVVVGCGDGRPATYPIQVKVAFADGAPLKGGRIELQSVDVTDRNGNAISATGIVQADGMVADLSTFAVGDGAVAGKHRVSVAPARRNAEGGSLFETTIDPKFLAFDTSGLEISVDADGGTQEFTLQVSPPTR